MNIHEMHDEFVIIGQKMGMKNIRTLLPESIDTYINKAINNKIRSIIATSNNSVIQNKILLKDNPINIINAFNTLYYKKLVNIDNTDINDYYDCFDNIENVLLYTSFSVKYKNINKTFNCRFVYGDELENTLNDYCNRASYEYPIITIFNNDNNIVFRFYINDANKEIENLIFNYIKQPAIVKYAEELDNSINCDLPDYLHNEIVELAVNEFIQSINIDKVNV